MVLINNQIDETLDKILLKQEIETRKTILQNISRKVDELKQELLVVKNQFDQNVGYLYIKIDLIDLKIEMYKKRLFLLGRNSNILEIENKIREEYSRAEERLKAEKDTLISGNITIKTIENISKEEKSELKILFKRLILKYHPDLINDNKLKKKYEEIIKQVVKAYEDSDIEALRKIELDTNFNSSQNTLDSLKKLLNIITKEIDGLKNEYKVLTNSKWTSLREAILQYRKQNRDYYTELKVKILSDIKTKENELNQLKKQYETSTKAIN